VSWQTWLEDLSIIHEESGTTRLSGPVSDQAALYGILLKLRHLGVTLLSREADELRKPEEKLSVSFHKRRPIGKMTYVITQPCIGVKDATCVDVCPVDCIHPSQNEQGFEESEHLFINPDECIDCGACEPACPVTAIFEELAVPAEWKSFIAINADFFRT